MYILASGGFGSQNRSAMSSSTRVSTEGSLRHSTLRTRTPKSHTLTSGTTPGAGATAVIVGENKYF